MSIQNSLKRHKLKESRSIQKILHEDHLEEDMEEAIQADAQEDMESAGHHTVDIPADTIEVPKGQAMEAGHQEDHIDLARAHTLAGILEAGHQEDTIRTATAKADGEPNFLE